MFPKPNLTSWCCNWCDCFISSHLWVTSQKIPALFSFCPSIKSQMTTTSFSFSLLLKLNKPSFLGISLQFLWSSLHRAGDRHRMFQLHSCCHSLVCRSCLHHEGTFLPCLPSAAQEGSAHPSVQTHSASSWHPASTAAH